LRISAVFGESSDMEDATEQLISEIQRAIELKVIVRGGNLAARRADQLRLCRRLVDNGLPVFITAPLGAFREVILRNVMTKFDFATFVLRSEIDSTESGSPNLIRPLTPPLSPELYDQFCALDDEVCDRLYGERVGGNGVWANG
jgi:hypothetical protein